jgi:hypothetical protein
MAPPTERQVRTSGVAPDTPLPSSGNMRIERSGWGASRLGPTETPSALTAMAARDIREILAPVTVQLGCSEIGQCALTCPQERLSVMPSAGTRTVDAYSVVRPDRIRICFAAAAMSQETEDAQLCSRLPLCVR